MIRPLLLVLTATLALGTVALADRYDEPAAAGVAKGPLADPNFFPVAVWMQSARNAARYHDIGINVYVAAGSDENTLATLKKLGMYAICEAGDKEMKQKGNSTIIAWMHGDEPDNAQGIGVWKSAEDIKQAWPEAPNKTLKQWGPYGPPIPPSRIIAGYKKIKEADPTRPVLLNLGQGVAWEGYYGRGYRTGKLEDYPEYLKGCDMASFDIYPVAHGKDAIQGKLEYVPQGVERLVKWGGGHKRVWNCIECTADEGSTKATPDQVRSEVWMSIIHGSRGLVYFCHVFKPKFIEAGVLEDKAMCDGIAAINKQVAELAPVINSPTAAEVTVSSREAEKAPIAIMAKRHGDATYVFAANMRNVDTIAAFVFKGFKGAATVEVLGEGRKVDGSGGKFADAFKGYAVHLYKITAGK